MLMPPLTCRALLLIVKWLLASLMVTESTPTQQKTELFVLASEFELLSWFIADRKKFPAWHTSLYFESDRGLSNLTNSTKFGIELWYGHDDGGSINYRYIHDADERAEKNKCGKQFYWNYAEARFVETKYSEHNKMPKGRPNKFDLSSHASEATGLAHLGGSEAVDVFQITLGSKYFNAESFFGDSDGMFKEFATLFPQHGYNIIYRNSNTFTDLMLFALLRIRLSAAEWGKQVSTSFKPEVLTGAMALDYRMFWIEEPRLLATRTEKLSNPNHLATYNVNLPFRFRHAEREIHETKKYYDVQQFVDIMAKTVSLSADWTKDIVNTVSDEVRNTLTSDSALPKIIIAKFNHEYPSFYQEEALNEAKRPDVYQDREHKDCPSYHKKCDSEWTGIERNTRAHHRLAENRTCKSIEERSGDPGSWKCKFADGVWVWAAKQPPWNKLQQLTRHAAVPLAYSGNKDTPGFTRAVAPVDLRSFSLLVDLLMANCIGFLYEEQVKVQKEWNTLNGSEAMTWDNVSAVDEFSCKDFDKWTDRQGWTCKVYEDSYVERLVGVMEISNTCCKDQDSVALIEADRSLDNGYSACQACCACGGGLTLENRQGPAIANVRRNLGVTDGSEVNWLEVKNGTRSL